MKTNTEDRKVQVKCQHPQYCWMCGTVYCKKDGVLSPNLVFNERKAYAYFMERERTNLLRSEFGHLRAVEVMMREARIEVPCGKCAICQISKRKDMSVRLTHEASQFENACFITLTYNDENVPATNSVPLREYIKAHKEGDFFRSMDKDFVRGKTHECCHLTLMPVDVQKFIKRLRRHLEYVPKKSRGVRDHVERIRYFAVGEYGSKTHRPHYHILIFGWKPSDADLLFMKDGRPVFRSKQIEKCWKYGYSSFCNVTPYVAKYCARYVTKKFARLDDKSVDSRAIVPEFTLQSTRGGGIGSTWFDRFGAAACRIGLCTYRAGERIIKAAIPKYYWSRLRRINLPLWLELRDERFEFVKHHKCLGYSIDLLNRQVDCERLKYAHFASKEVF